MDLDYGKCITSYTLRAELLYRLSVSKIDDKNSTPEPCREYIAS